ncbi:O-antigen ligase family protein [Abyssogena phaseoliformis symbiont]|uniref:O-antigen ligase family protein n=1 Tax=Abyssogena phaseoliformis symbiont TaxID=596095 RepID=UPI001914E87F|nr:O-antigen ligase family protein [Abyssogena phaseoliformis symbiont]
MLINYINQGWQWHVAGMPEYLNNALSCSNTRIPTWLNTLGMIKDHFLIWGAGVGNWEQVYPLYYDEVAKALIFNGKTRLQRLHNSYLEMFTNVGLIGYGFLLWLVALTVKSAYSLLNKAGLLTCYLCLALC